MATITPVSRLKSLLDLHHYGQRVRLNLEQLDAAGYVEIGPEAFDAVIIHLLNNALEAAPAQPVTISVERDATRVIIEITDQGPGMSPEFIRDELFSPFKTRRVGGSGIGAFQARELITEVGGELSVISQRGVGSTMRVLFTRADELNQMLSTRFLLKASGEYGG